MLNSRKKRANINIIVSLGCQIITIICGLITPRLMLKAYGSEAYGLSTSIAQFLGYITLLEGGIGGVARAALYKPLAENNITAISAIVDEIKRFFRIVAYIFCVYVLVLASCFKFISHTEYLDWSATFVLVVAISISTFGQYFIGISYAVLLQAAQKVYINNMLSIGLTVVNTIMIVMLVNLGCNLIVVKLMSSCIFLIRPLILWSYSRNQYKFDKSKKCNQNLLEQKWSGLGQHIAFFLHSNTDTVVLTIFSNLTSVAVYAVYNMVINNIKNLTMAFHSGMEAVFGDMLAKREMKELHKTFENYETLISIVSVILFSVTSVMIVPFVKIYTLDINDANYIMPTFSMLLIFAAILYCLRAPYHSIVIAAGHFRETQVAAYGEAVINIVLSIALVFRYNLIGVAIATVIATLFRFIYYVQYLSNNIMNRKKRLFVRRLVINSLIFSINIILGNLIVAGSRIENYVQWIVVALAVTLLAGVSTIFINYFSYPIFFDGIVMKIKNKLKI